MDINNFLNPADKTIQDDPDKINEYILAQFEPDIEKESDKELEIFLEYLFLNQSKL